MTWASISTGSVIAIVPAIQPSNIAPSVMIDGKRSIRRITNWLPQTMIGMLTTMPKITSAMLWSPPADSAAPAMAITLSRLITKSATITVLTAPHKRSLPLMSAWPSPCSGSSSLTPIHSSSSAPANLRNGIASSCSAKKIKPDAQHDRPGRAPHDALGALLGRQLAAGQRDHHRVVAAQQDVDQDDLTDGDPELGGA